MTAIMSTGQHYCMPACSHSTGQRDHPPICQQASLSACQHSNVPACLLDSMPVCLRACRPAFSHACRPACRHTMSVYQHASTFQHVRRPVCPHASCFFCHHEAFCSTMVTPYTISWSFLSPRGLQQHHCNHGPLFIVFSVAAWPLSSDQNVLHVVTMGC